MWIGISIFIVLISGLVIWFLSSSGVSEVVHDPRQLSVRGKASFEDNCKYLASVGLLRDSDCNSFLHFSDLVAQLAYRYSRGYHTGFRPSPKVEDSLMSLNMRNLVVPFDSNPSERTLFGVYDKTSKLRAEAQKVEADLKLAKKYKVPYYVNFEGGVYWVLPN